MRIAIFTETYYPFVSGVVTHIETLRNCLEAQGHAVMIVTADPNIEEQHLTNNILYCPAITLKRVYGYGLANPYNHKRLEIVREFSPDIIHIHTEFGIGMFGKYCAKQLKRPYVYTLHTMYDEYVYYMFPGKAAAVAKPAMRAHIKRMAMKATEVIGPSVKVSDYLETCGASCSVHIIPNAVFLDKFQCEQVEESKISEVKERLGIKCGDISLCFVGRLGNEKSIDVLIEYFAKAALSERYKLFLIGDGPERERLEALIREFGIENQVRLLGRIEHEELPSYYQAFDLYATASLTEMNSISFLEAGASGLFTLQRFDNINRGQISKGENGDFFTDADEFSQLLHQYASFGISERQIIRERASKFTARYGTDEFTKSVLLVYNKALFKSYGLTWGSSEMNLTA